MRQEKSDNSNLREAFSKVSKNQGAAGPDGKSITTVSKNLIKLLPQLSEALRKEEYRPGEVRRVWIPKPSGGERTLGIPNVIDRLVQQAVLQILQPHFERNFSEHSHGFRPGRSCHTAIKEAQTYVEDGYEWVVDIDLAKFFDTVNHQRLVALLHRKVEDKRIVYLIRKMLKANVVLPDGVVVTNEEGTPQGGPLSPLLSNLVLTELDEELTKRGLRFVRYADDTNVYVRSERAAKRVMESLTRFIEKRLRLTVNREKSAAARTSERHFLGFRIERDALTGDAKVKLSQRTVKRITKKVKDLTPRNWGNSVKYCISKLNAYIVGWSGFFHIVEGEDRQLKTLDAHIRRRLRAVILRHQKSKRGMMRCLIRRGLRAKTAIKAVYMMSHRIWALSHCSAVDRAFPNRYFEDLGLRSILDECNLRRVNLGIRFATQLGLAI